MLRSLREAELAMRVQQARIETLANNLANVDATGFKQVLSRVSQGPDPSTMGGADGGTTPAASSLPAVTGERGLARPGGGLPAPDDLRVRTFLDPRPGPLRETGRPTDIAVRGDGYLVVQRGDRELFTRGGALRLDEQRRLVDGAGNPVLGTGGPLRLEGETLEIRPDGTVLTDGAEAGRLRLVRFEDPSRLAHRGDGLLAAPEDMPPQEAGLAEAELVQGCLEGSNVDPIDTLVAMIAAQRAFEIETKVIQSEDQTLDRSVNELGRAR